MDYDITLQRQAYLDARGYTILTACPGSGKTTSIVKKLLTVSRYCEEHYGKHTGFACLSFTNKACAELKQKYREMHDERITFPNEVLTIDSFIMQYVVLPFWYLCDECKQRPIVVNEAEILDRIYYNNVKINGKWQQYPVMALRSYTSLMYRKNPSLVSRDKTGFKWNRKTITENEIAYCNAAFTYRLEKGFITSSDALWIACDILERHQSVAKALVMRFPYIIVDEAQDNSELHFELFKLLKRAGLQNIEFVGDICQSIYGFNNARPELLQSMMVEAEWNVLPLSECRRSNQRIINLYSKLKSSDVPTIISHNVEDKGVPIVVYKYEDGNIRAMFRSLGMNEGMAFIQCFNDKGKYIVYEMGYRLTGSIEQHLMEHAYCFNHLKAILRFAVGDTVDVTPLQTERLGNTIMANVTLLLSEGTISHYVGEEEVMKIPGVLHMHKSYPLGKVIDNTIIGKLAQVGIRVLLYADDREQLLRRMDEVKDTLKVESTEQKDMLLRNYSYQEMCCL